MAPKRTLLEQMKANPNGNWQIKDVIKVCKAHGLSCTAPTRGDHYKVSSEHITDIQSVPAWKPIKQFYIKRVTMMIECHLRIVSEKAQAENENNKKPRTSATRTRRAIKRETGS